MLVMQEPKVDAPGEPSGEGTAEVFERHVAPVRQALVDLLEAQGALVKRWGSLPAADSQAMAEIAAEKDYLGEGPWGDEPVHQAFNLAHLLVLGAEDSASAACRLLSDEPTPVFAHMVLARSVLEHAGRAWWLFEPRIGVRRRIARGFNERLNSLVQQEFLPLRPADKAKARNRRGRIFAEAERLGFKKVAERKKPAWLEEERPSSTKVIRQLLAGGDDPTLGGAVYGYFSAVVHGTTFGLSQSVDIDAPGGPETPGVTWGAVYTSSRDVCTVLTAMILALSHTYKTRSAVLGWRSDECGKAAHRALHAARTALGY